MDSLHGETTHLVLGKEYADIPYLNEVAVRQRNERALAAWYIVRYHRSHDSLHAVPWVSKEDFIAICQRYFVYGRANPRPLQRRSIIAKCIEPGLGLYWERSGDGYAIYGAAQVVANFGLDYINETVRRPISDLQGTSLGDLKTIFARSILERSSDHNRAVSTVALQTGYSERSLYRRIRNSPQLRKVVNWEIVSTVPFNGNKHRAREQAQSIIDALHRALKYDNKPAYISLYADRRKDRFVIVRRLPNGYLPSHRGWTPLASRVNARLRRLVGEREGSSCKRCGNKPFNVSAHARRVIGAPLPGVTRKREAYIVHNEDRHSSRGTKETIFWSPQDQRDPRGSAAELLSEYMDEVPTRAKSALRWVQRRALHSSRAVVA